MASDDTLLIQDYSKLKLSARKPQLLVDGYGMMLGARRCEILFLRNDGSAL